MMRWRHGTALIAIDAVPYFVRATTQTYRSTPSRLTNNSSCSSMRLMIVERLDKRTKSMRHEPFPDSEIFT